MSYNFFDGHKARTFDVTESFRLNGTQVTATANELNKLAGAGVKVASGTQVALITDPTGGATIDAESRARINAIIDALQAFGIVLT